MHERWAARGDLVKINKIISGDKVHHLRYCYWLLGYTIVFSSFITPRACTRDKAIGFSVIIVVVVVVVDTKIARFQVLGIYVCCKHNQLVDIGEKLIYIGFKLLKKAYECYKSCIFCSTCLWFIYHTHSFSMLMRLRMLKLSVGKGHQVIKQLCRRVLQSYATMATEHVGYICSTKL